MSALLRRALQILLSTPCIFACQWHGVLSNIGGGIGKRTIVFVFGVQTESARCVHERPKSILVYGGENAGLEKVKGRTLGARGWYSLMRER